MPTVSACQADDPGSSSPWVKAGDLIRDTNSEEQVE